MIIPNGFPNASKTCNCALYGLRQASRAWYSRIDTFFTTLGRSNEDPNLYYSTRKGKYTIILLYVDDIIITANDDANINTLKEHMMSSFKMSDLGDIMYYLGVKIEKILERFGMSNCTSLTAPMNPKT
jgi:hypothetical protein